MNVPTYLLLVYYLYTIQGKIELPFQAFLIQEEAIGVLPASLESNELPPNTSVPMIMRILFEEAERVNSAGTLPQGGDFQHLARSIEPTHIEEVGLQRVVLDFPPLEIEDHRPGTEVWLVFQTRTSHILGHNCTQVLTVYENDQPEVKSVITVPLNYKNNEPLLLVNITNSLLQKKERPSRPSYIVIIKDSTSYIRDEHLFSFANYIDCSLARACEVLELRDPQSSPVLLMLSPELAAKDLLLNQGRYRRHSEYYSTESSGELSAGSMVGRVEDNPCQLKDWVVNVEQLGWDWLVYPERIPLNLCVGFCPILLDRYFNATSHAVARGLFRLVLGQAAKPENTMPCCVPVKYRRFTMLIEKTAGIISLETSSDLSVGYCGCR